MSLIELHVETNVEHADALSDQLTLLGAHAITFQDAGDQPLYEPKPGALDLWPTLKMIGLFDETLSVEAILAFLKEQQRSEHIKEFSIKKIVDQDWERACLESFKPMPFGKRLWICPSWQTPPDPLAVNLILDPGLAFGTGTHPTTSLCLTWLEQHIQPQQSVIDYGCGSGILGLAALKLGAKKVIAVDHDTQALEATQKNAARNHMTPKQLITCLPRDLPTPLKADLLIANILARPLIELAESFASMTTHQLLLSGILYEQIDSIISAYSTWFKQIESIRQDEWAALYFMKK
ncbi:MAG: hypothetical protein ACD_60C00128G0005 [uncultured bacterium]|nr:MAG: hypothetical protein ACD_60C00128G0005 [uncultured bacterium]HCB30794.1 50S ribosomal protein L11 methyltransferase [Acinetobacter lwoffii]